MGKVVFQLNTDTQWTGSLSQVYAEYLCLILKGKIRQPCSELALQVYMCTCTHVRLDLCFRISWQIIYHKHRPPFPPVPSILNTTMCKTELSLLSKLTSSTVPFLEHSSTTLPGFRADLFLPWPQVYDEGSTTQLQPMSLQSAHPLTPHAPRLEISHLSPGLLCWPPLLPQRLPHSADRLFPKHTSMHCPIQKALSSQHNTKYTFCMKPSWFPHQN